MRRGLAFGWFDPLHYAHIRFLRSARAQCDHLTVILNETGSKAEPPLVPVTERVQDVADLRTVDAVMRRGTRSRDEWVRALAPAVLFVGPENTHRYEGVEVVVLPRTPGISSTELRREIRVC